MSLKNLSNEHLLTQLKTLVQTERKITAEILNYICELDMRRLYLEQGFTSTFAFFTEGLGYSPAAAQGRIDGARLLRDVPSLTTDLASGEVNLMQISLIAQSVRQKIKEQPSLQIKASDKQDLLSAIKGQTVASTQKILAQTLDLEIQTFEKKRLQKDESVRVELTLSSSQMATPTSAIKLKPKTCSFFVRRTTTSSTFRRRAGPDERSLSINMTLLPFA